MLTSPFLRDVTLLYDPARRTVNGSVDTLVETDLTEEETGEQTVAQPRGIKGLFLKNKGLLQEPLAILDRRPRQAWIDIRIT